MFYIGNEPYVPKSDEICDAEDQRRPPPHRTPQGCDCGRATAHYMGRINEQGHILFVDGKRVPACERCAEEMWNSGRWMYDPERPVSHRPSRRAGGWKVGVYPTGIYLHHPDVGPMPKLAP